MSAPAPRGIQPSLLLQQVRNSADWALATHADAQWARTLADAPALDASFAQAERRPDYLRVLLAAHFATVGTFVPTDVDTQIRHHQWQGVRDADQLGAMLDVVDQAATWSPALVSAKVVDLGDAGPLSGHDGEWFSVRAGALGRALTLRAEAHVERLVSQIEAELSREAEALRRALRVAEKPGAARHALCVVTTLAHNLGDLSRVVEAWPEGTPGRADYADRYVRLGHEAGGRFDGLFALAGDLNKAVMAVESHRYLPLREPRALRTSRAHLLPFPPWLDAWGEALGRDFGRSDPEALAEIVTALLEGHRRTPKQLAWGRALAGIHRTSPGGLDRLGSMLPSRLRKDFTAGPLRDALAVDPARFEARVANLLKAARAARS